MFGNLFRVYLVIGTILMLFCKVFYPIKQIFIAVKWPNIAADCDYSERGFTGWANPTKDFRIPSYLYVAPYGVVQRQSS